MLEGNEKSYEIIREKEQKNLFLNYENNPLAPTLEDNDFCFEKVFNIILEVGQVTQIILREERNYVYPYSQTRIINELVKFYEKVVKVEELVKDLGKDNQYFIEVNKRLLLEFKKIVISDFKKDPVGVYLKILRLKRLVNIEVKEETDEGMKLALKEYVKRLSSFLSFFEKTKMYELVKQYLPGYKSGDRTVYRIIFEPEIKPNFMHTRLQNQPPITSREIDLYKLTPESEVVIYDNPKTVVKEYFIHPAEFKLSDEEYSLLTEAREAISKHKPAKEEFVNPERMREVFYNISKDLIEQLISEKGLGINYKRIDVLSKILVRLTVGFGLIEEILRDPNIEDIYINPPIGQTPILVVHNKYGEMRTNIIPNIRDGRSWASRFRLLSGRPLDEAHPVMDTELSLPHARVRVAIVQHPLSIKGLSFVFRKHRDKPWTFPLLVKEKELTSFAAGLLWFFIDGSRAILIAGTRGSGKTSLLGALMVSIMRKYRIITVEDTQELPIDYLQKINYDIVGLKVRSAILGEKNEISATDGIRTTLRLGDSALIVGEVRGEETVALYEAMRVGALANVVCGTIHGESAYGVFDRVVNDLKVPKTSFKATDIIVIINKIKTPDGLSEKRRVISITEVRKEWDDDPLKEKAFVELMNYDAKTDELIPTPALIEGESSVLKSIASRVKEWSTSWDKIIQNIELRGKIIQKLVDASKEFKNLEILESDFVTESNDIFHKLIEEESKKHGYPSNESILRDYERWLKNKLSSYGK